MKKIIAVLIVIILIVLAVTLIIMNRKEEVVVPPETTPVVELSPSEKIVINEMPTENHTSNIAINVKRPVITNLVNYEQQEIINSKIADSINPYIDEIAAVSEGSSYSKSYDNLVDNKLYHYDVDFERYNNDIFLSIVVEQNIRISLPENETGGLRSNKWKDTYVIDCKTGKEAFLKDVCGFANYKSYIVAEINKQAKAKNIPLVGNSEILDISDNQKFFIKDGKLYIYFRPAAIAPYLAGELIFEMPFTYENEKFVR